MNYSCVVYTDVDEIIVPKPNVYPGGLKQYLNMFIDKGEAMLYVRVKAYELVSLSSRLHLHAHFYVVFRLISQLILNLQ